MLIQRVDYRGATLIKMVDEDTGKTLDIMTLRDAADLAQAILFEQQDVEQEEVHG